MRPLKILHVFPTFEPGGIQARAVDLMNELGDGFLHLVAAMDGVTTMVSRVRPGVGLETVEAPVKAGSYATARSAAKLIAACRPDLVATYNWGTIETAMAAVLFSSCPVLHAEDGFGPDEASQLARRRVWTRRVVLRGAKGVVVPSRTMERIALERYRLPRRKVIYLPNGVDTMRFAPSRSAAARERFGLPPAGVVVGAVGHLRPEKNLELLLAAFAQIGDESTRLLVVGDGPCRAGLEARAAELGLGRRAVFAGMLSDTTEAYAAMDIFAMSSATEQMPVALLEAMACGLPAVLTDVGDCAVMVARHAMPVIVPAGDTSALAAALETMIASPELRDESGRSNRSLCQARYDRSTMLERYRQLYRWAAGRGPAPEHLL